MVGPDDGRRVLIWQSRNLPSLPFMYGPVTGTLVAAFRASPNVEVKNGAGTKRNDSFAFLRSVDWLRRGDIFVWVGLSMSQAPWLTLGQRGVRRVLYQTEPTHRCEARRVGRFAVDELWDFSHHNLEACDAAADAPRVRRYVPLGALDSALLRINGRAVLAAEPGHADGQRSVRVLDRVR